MYVSRNRCVGLSQISQLSQPDYVLTYIGNHQGILENGGSLDGDGDGDGDGVWMG